VSALSREEESFDAVVVGSGFGGAVTACRLAEGGLRVLVLERGQPYPPGSFARTPREMQRAFWDPPAGLHGLFELWRFTGLDVACASGLGGGSLIYANVMLPKDETTFVREDMGAGGRECWPIGHADLESHYDAVRAMLRPQRFPSEGEPYASIAKTRAMEQAADALGLEFERPELAVLFSPDQDREPVPGAPIEGGDLHGLPRSTCRLCGECDLGCNYGAKNTLDFTYLSAAQRAGAQLRSCCEVRTIEALDHGDDGYRIGYRQHLDARAGHRADLLDPIEQPSRAVRARRLILAAGAVGSTRLLLANRAGLPGMSRALGARVSANGDALALIRDARSPASNGHAAPRYLDPSRGPVITASIKVPADRSPSGRGHQIQDGGAPILADWMWEAIELPKLPWRMRHAIARHVRGVLSGRRDTNLGLEAAQLFSDRSASLMPLLANGRDTPDGRYVLEDGRLDLDWSSAPSEEYYRGVELAFDDVSAVLGGRHVTSPWKRINRSVTIHPLGGCAMADDSRHGVVDTWGEAFGFPGLYVADGAAMPGPVGVNPSFTIAAFAERVAEGILRGAKGA
jgi:cholesterol oxidase